MSLYEFKEILDTDQFSKENLDFLMEKIQKMDSLVCNKDDINFLKGKILASIFFESSTRTRLSFESAMLRLGGSVISTVGFQFSSISKGESLYDTMRVIESYCDIIVIRHPLEGSSRIASSAVNIPVINAGDGSGEHPTQAIIDLYTILQEKSKIDGLKIAFVGDLKYGRTIHSLINLLKHYKVHIELISPPELSLPSIYKEKLEQYPITLNESSNLNTAKDSDILYVTRIQEERFSNYQEFEKLKNSFELDLNTFHSFRNQNMSIMHPLPRLSEIKPEIDNLKNAIYFKQAANGVTCRMALLLLCLKDNF